MSVRLSSKRSTTAMHEYTPDVDKTALIDAFPYETSFIGEDLTISS